jgi:anti-sigma regulatory factor (Ser/Thr protein kinase)
VGRHRGDSSGLTRWDGVSAESLAQALAAPAVDCVEAGVVGPRPGRRLPGAHRLGLRVTAQSVYRHPIARVFAGALQVRLGLSAELLERVHTALQEALMNAMMHGNLGLGEGLRDNRQALAASRDLIEARFAIGPIARSMIRVEATWSEGLLRVAVRDNGDGYGSSNLPTLDERMEAGQVGSGRGLLILERLCDHIGLHRGGTTIALDFRLPAGDG